MNNSCNCNKDCGCGKCRPASYTDCSFDIQTSPYNDNEWLVTMNGMMHKVRIPSISEKDTTLSTNYTNSTLNYAAEKHTDTISGEQLGSIIELGNLRDINFDPTFSGTCSELIYRKYADCGEGCQTPADQWSGFNINSDGAKQSYIKYVRGTNAYGCPQYLDVPANTNQYYYAGWRTDGENKQFGYYQPGTGALPKDSNGNYIVASYNQTTKQPIYGALPLDCIMRNLMGNLGMDIYGTFSVIQATPAFSAELNPITGDFQIIWNDWLTDTAQTHIGRGVVTGKVNWTATFDTNSGNMQYHISSVYFNRVDWTVDHPYTGGIPIYFTLKGVSIPSGTETMLLNHRYYAGNASWSETINQTINCNQTITVAPGQKVGPLNFAYAWCDWVNDDEGYLQINFKNKLQGWKVCE